MRYLALSVLLTFSFAPDRPNPSPPPPPPPPIMDFENLQGTWTVIDYETQNGKMDAQSLKNHSKLVIKGNAYGWGSPGSGTFKIDPTKTPKTVDYYQGPGNNPNQIWLGIYEIHGDTFRDCIAPPGQPRPKDFSTPAGSGHIMQVHKRMR